jgi:hypothetical protein
MPMWPPHATLDRRMIPRAAILFPVSFGVRGEDARMQAALRNLSRGQAEKLDVVPGHNRSAYPLTREWRTTGPVVPPSRSPANLGRGTSPAPAARRCIHAGARNCACPHMSCTWGTATTRAYGLDVDHTASSFQLGFKAQSASRNLRWEQITMAFDPPQCYFIPLLRTGSPC